MALPMAQSAWEIDEKSGKSLGKSQHFWRSGDPACLGGTKNLKTFDSLEKFSVRKTCVIFVLDCLDCNSIV